MGKALHVILQRDVLKLGKGGEVVKVSAGYARNYLLPLGFALPASEGNVSRFEHQKKVAAEKAAKLRGEAQGQAAKLSALEITVARSVGSEGKLYGSVTARDLEAALKDKGFNVDRKKLTFDHVRALGTYEVTAKLAQEVSATFKLHVVADSKSAS
jgi:large subunit ribosomal protein L9